MLEIHNFTQNQIAKKFFQQVAEICLKTVSREKTETEISLAIVGDGRMRKLNKFYRGKNRSTDVLSFANKGDFVEPPDNIKRLGEIVICYPRAKKQAKRAGHSLKRELTILLIHGILHLLGYEHEKGGAAEEEMKAMELKILVNI